MTRKSVEAFIRRTAAKKNSAVLTEMAKGFDPTDRRAWKHAVPLCKDFEDEDERAIVLTVLAGASISIRAGVWAGAQEPPMNFGESLRTLNLPSGEGRFRSIVSTSSSGAVCRLLPNLLRLMATQPTVPVDYGQLYEDLMSWGQETKSAWSQSFYG